MGNELDKTKQDEVLKLRAMHDASKNKKVYVETLVILCDTSGSMDEATSKGISKLMYMQNLLLDFFNISHDSELRLVSFDSEARSHINGFVDGTMAMIANGSTNLGAGLMEALLALMSSDTRHKRVILLTDGIVTCDVDLCLRLAGKCHENGVVVDCIGFGIDIDEELLKDIAMITGGRYQRADNIESIDSMLKQLETRLYLESKQ